MSDLEGWTRVIEEINDQDDKDTQSEPAIKGENGPVINKVNS